MLLRRREADFVRPESKIKGLRKAIKTAYLDCIYTCVNRRKLCAGTLERFLVGGEPFLQVEPCLD